MPLNRRNINTVQKLFAPLLLIWSQGSFATNYYVSGTGNDLNNGTSMVTAWATIAKVNSTVFLPGDALYFEGGQTFTGSIFLPATDANDPANIFLISSYGIGDATINAGTSYGLYAFNTQGFSISNLIFDGNSSSTNGSAGIMIFSDLTGDVKLSNISIGSTEVKNFGAEGITIHTSNNLTGFVNVTLSNLTVHDVVYNGIITYGFISQSLVGWQHKNITVSNCEVYNVVGSTISALDEGSGIVLEGVDGGIVKNCTVHDNGQNNVMCGGPVGIWTLESNNIIIESCESYHNHNGTGCDGGGFDLDGGVTNSILQYNYSHDNDGAGYLMGQYPNARSWSNNTVRYNISQNDGVKNEGGIGLFKGPGTLMNGANIFNNTIYTSAQSANATESVVYIKDWFTGINNISFYNNIFLSAGTVSLIDIPVGYSAFFAGNIYWSGANPFSIIYQGNTYSSLASWRTATGNEILSGTNTGSNSDPLLTNVGGGGTIGFGNSLMSLDAYKISSPSSPAYQTALDINALFSINTGTQDFWGTSLPGGITNDIGANEFTGTLPIVLLNFSGNCSGTGQDISWATGEETNMKSIELMYSKDGSQFRILTDMNTRGNNSLYNYQNDLTSPGDNYYQLKMIGLDGSISYSSVLDIKCGTLSDKITVGPNPFSNSFNLSIESISGGPATISLYDATGKAVSQRTPFLQSGSNLVSYEGLSLLSPGIYYLRIDCAGKTSYLKLIKAGN
jgi:hypothetical protein